MQGNTTYLDDSYRDDKCRYVKSYRSRDISRDAMNFLKYIIILFALGSGVAQEAENINIWDIPIHPTDTQGIFSFKYVKYPNASQIPPAYSAYLNEMQKWKDFSFSDVKRLDSLTQSDPLLSFLARSTALFKKNIVHVVPLEKASLESMLFEVMIQDWASSRPLHLCLANIMGDKNGLFELEGPQKKYFPIMLRTIRPEHCEIALVIFHRFISPKKDETISFRDRFEELSDAISASFAAWPPIECSSLIALLKRNEETAIYVRDIETFVALGLGLAGTPVPALSEQIDFFYRIGQFTSGRKTYGELGEKREKIWNHMSREMMWTYGEKMIIEPELFKNIPPGSKLNYLNLLPLVRKYFSSTLEQPTFDLGKYQLSKLIRPILMYLPSPLDFNKTISAIDAEPRAPGPRMRNIYLVAKKCPTVEYNKYKVWVDSLPDQGEREAAMIGWIRAEHSQDESDYKKDLSLVQSVTTPAGTVLAFRALAKKWRMKEHDALMRLMNADSTNEYVFTGIGLGCISSTMDDIFLY